MYFVCLTRVSFCVIYLQLVGNTTEHLPAEVQSRNALEQIPILEFNDSSAGTQTLTQSLAIIEFLEEAFPKSRHVFPSNPLLRARSRQVRG